MASSGNDGPITMPVSAHRVSRWVLIALTSGAFAALNGAFAKLTTAGNTSALAHALVPASSPLAPAFETGLRAAFFGLNLASNAVMWALFTRALAAGSSATRVSVLNTSANFLVTAVLGWMWFGERLASLWFVGAACLVGGAAVVSRSRDGDDGPGKKAAATAETAGGSANKDPGPGEDEQDTLLLDLDSEEEGSDGVGRTASRERAQ